MNPEDFPLSLYLQRIALSNPPAPDEDGLKQIHAAQAYSLPFENLDIHLGRSISLEPGNLVAKLLERKRGGYCFELNELLRMALRKIGFTVRPVLARVLFNRPAPGPLTHEVLIVTISGRDWLADTGFGGPGLRLPLEMISGRVHEQLGDRFILNHGADSNWVLQKFIRDKFVNLYIFRDLPALDVDLEMSNHFTSTWPSSIFRIHRMCALSKSWGRITLTDMELSIYRDGLITGKTLLPGSEYMEALAEHFGLHVDADYRDFIIEPGSFPSR
jgi:N-hydroxyarylamine O-acetyltransferase